MEKKKQIYFGYRESFFLKKKKKKKTQVRFFGRPVAAENHYSKNKNKKKLSQIFW
jgi:hypothetical protein